MKFKKTIVALNAMLFTMTLSTSATANIVDDAGDKLMALYDGFIDKWNKHDPQLDWPIAHSWGLLANDLYIETPSSYEPTVNDYLNYYAKTQWSDAHAYTCPQTNKFRKMPIRTEASNYVTVDGVSIKSFTAQQGVPFRFRAKEHGGLTDLLSDSYYFWSFGNGTRRFNRNNDDSDTTYSYQRIGNYYLSSIVYSTEMYFGFNVKGGIDDGSWQTDDLKYSLIYESDVVYLEGCDIAEVNVVYNNAPNASAYAYLRSSKRYGTTFNFSGSDSSDPDGNPLTYSWTYNGTTKTGESVMFTFPTRATAKHYTVTLTVTDGGKSDSTNKTVLVEPYCYSCNGEQVDF
jgi:hypothetical protein